MDGYEGLFFWGAIFILVLICALKVRFLLTIMNRAYTRLVEGLKWDGPLLFLIKGSSRGKRMESEGSGERDSQFRLRRIFPRSRRST